MVVGGACGGGKASSAGLLPVLRLLLFLAELGNGDCRADDDKQDKESQDGSAECDNRPQHQSTDKDADAGDRQEWQGNGVVTHLDVGHGERRLAGLDAAGGAAVKADTATARAQTAMAREGGGGGGRLFVQRRRR